MEKLMNNKIDEVIKCIIDSPEYKECIELKNKMKLNKEITSRVNEIKVLQKKYLRTNALDVKERLDLLEKELYEIPIYVIYNQKLEVVNQMINYVNEEINDYFYKLFN